MKEFLECWVRRFLKDYSVEKVIAMESSPAVGKFENFLSTVSRLKLKVVLGNGRLSRRSIIVKMANTADSMSKSDYLTDFSNKHNVFQIETMMYSMVLREMEYLMEEFGDTDSVLWGHLIHHIPYTCLLFDDLKVQGFNMLERTEFFDLDHGLLAVHSLGRYHAMCKALEESGVISKDYIKPWYIFDDIKIHKYLFWDMESLKRGIKLLWDPTWNSVVDKIDLSMEALHERIKRLGVLDETKFNVLNHGDCHKNNLLFKYDWKNQPIDIRFLDFQLVHYGSPSTDLTYLLYLGVKPSVRKNNMEILLKTYHNSLLKTMNTFQVKGERPTFDEITESMEKYLFLGEWIFLTWYPFMIQSEKTDELFDYNKIESTGGIEGYSMDLYKIDSLESDLGPDLKMLVQKFF